MYKCTEAVRCGFWKCTAVAIDTQCRQSSAKIEFRQTGWLARRRGLENPLSSGILYTWHIPVYTSMYIVHTSMYHAYFQNTDVTGTCSCVRILNCTYHVHTQYIHGTYFEKYRHAFEHIRVHRGVAVDFGPKHSGWSINQLDDPSFRSIYSYILVYTSTYEYIRVHTSTYEYITV